MVRRVQIIFLTLDDEIETAGTLMRTVLRKGLTDPNKITSQAYMYHDKEMKKKKSKKRRSDVYTSIHVQAWKFI